MNPTTTPFPSSDAIIPKAIKKVFREYGKNRPVFNTISHNESFESKEHMKLNYWKIGFITNGLLPFGSIISLISFYFHASRILGRFPRYNQPDPKELDIYKHYSGILNSSCIIWIFSLLALIIMVMAYLIVKRRGINWRLIGLNSIGHLTAIILFLSKIMEWFAD